MSRVIVFLAEWRRRRRQRRDRDEAAEQAAYDQHLAGQCPPSCPWCQSQGRPS
jgi:ribosome modulation factor